MVNCRTDMSCPVWRQYKHCRGSDLELYQELCNGKWFAIDDPASGYNPDDPWTGREPRFYSDIAVDGDKMVASAAAGPDQFYTDIYRWPPPGTANGTVTGFYYKRYSPIGCNQWIINGVPSRHMYHFCVLPIFTSCTPKPFSMVTALLRPVIRVFRPLQQRVP